MKNILATVLTAFVLVGAVSAQAPNATGTWDINLTTPNGPMTVALVLKKDGEKLSGTIAGPQGEVAVEGTQKDKAIVVNFSVQTQNGPFAIVMNGNQDGDAAAGTIDFGGQGQAEWNGKRRGGAGSGPAAAPAAGATQADAKVDVTGVWALQLEIAGNVATPSATLKQEGEKLTGTYSSQVLGEQPLTGTIKGNAISFSIQATVEGNAVKVTYEGTVERDTMKGTVTLGELGSGTFTGKKK
jgi:hypothetical protein